MVSGRAHYTSQSVSGRWKVKDTGTTHQRVFCVGPNKKKDSGDFAVCWEIKVYFCIFSLSVLDVSRGCVGVGVRGSGGAMLGRLWC